MEIPFQDDVYIWASYSFSSFLNYIPIFCNVIIWLIYDFIFPCTLTYFLKLKLNSEANTNAWESIRIFEDQYDICPEGK